MSPGHNIGAAISGLVPSGDIAGKESLKAEDEASARPGLKCGLCYSLLCDLGQGTPLFCVSSKNGAKTTPHM